LVFDSPRLAVLAGENLTDPRLRHADDFRQPVRCDAHRLKEPPQQDLARRGAIHFAHGQPLVVVDDADVRGAPVGEAKAHAPPMVDADPPPASAVAFQRLAPVVRRDAQFLDPDQAVAQRRLSHRRRLDVPDASHSLLIDKRLGVFAAERVDRQGPMPMHCVGSTYLRIPGGRRGF
jgi:hypothetical protein